MTDDDKGENEILSPLYSFEDNPAAYIVYTLNKQYFIILRFLYLNL